MFSIIKIRIEDRIGRIMADKDKMEDIKNKEDHDRMMIIETVDPEMKEIIIDLYIKFI
jgi:hypothetical protein